MKEYGIIRKINTPIDYPVQGLNLAAFATPNDRQQWSTCSLTSVINHKSKSADDGHYFSFVKHAYSKLWHKFNDATVNIVNTDDIVSEDAYILIYEIEK